MKEGWYTRFDRLHELAMKTEIRAEIFPSLFDAIMSRIVTARNVTLPSDLCCTQCWQLRPAFLVTLNWKSDRRLLNLSVSAWHIAENNV